MDLVSEINVYIILVLITACNYIFYHMWQDFNIDKVQSQNHSKLFKWTPHRLSV